MQMDKIKLPLLMAVYLEKQSSLSLTKRSLNSIVLHTGAYNYGSKINYNGHTLKITNVNTPAWNETHTGYSDHLYDGGYKVIGQKDMEVKEILFKICRVKLLHELN